MHLLKTGVSNSLLKRQGGDEGEEPALPPQKRYVLSAKEGQ
jgi:hypothetical protein